MKRYPELMVTLSTKEMQNKKSKTTKMKVKLDPDLCNFDIEKIRKKLKSLNTPNEKLIYIEYVRKEAKHNKNNFSSENEFDELIKFLNIETGFYYKTLQLSSLSKGVNIENSSIKEPVRFHWQDDNTLIPYLIKLLYNEGFISPADWENRKEFIEQSFYKNEGDIFTAKEVASVEHGMKYNVGEKPRKSFKAERIVKKMKLKGEEIKNKPISKSKK